MTDAEAALLLNRFCAHFLAPSALHANPLGSAIYDFSEFWREDFEHSPL